MGASEELFVQYRLDRERADERAPALNSILKKTDESDRYDRPTTWLGVQRLKRILRNDLRTRKANTEHAKKVDSLYGEAGGAS